MVIYFLVDNSSLVNNLKNSTKYWHSSISELKFKRNRWLTSNNTPYSLNKN